MLGTSWDAIILKFSRRLHLPPSRTTIQRQPGYHQSDIDRDPLTIRKSQAITNLLGEGKTQATSLPTPPPPLASPTFPSLTRTSMERKAGRKKRKRHVLLCIYTHHK